MENYIPCKSSDVDLVKKDIENHFNKLFRFKPNVKIEGLITGQIKNISQPPTTNMR